MGQNRVVGIPYQIEEVTKSFTVNFAVDLYQVDAPSGSPVTVTLDPYAVRGDRVSIQDIGGNAGTQPITIVAANGQAIFGSSTSITINENYGRIDFTFNGASSSWLPVLTQGADPASFVQGGNAFGTTGILGTTDGNVLDIITGGHTRLTLADGTAGTTALDAPGTLTIGGSTATSITIGGTSTTGIQLTLGPPANDQILTISPGPVIDGIVYLDTPGNFYIGTNTAANIVIGRTAAGPVLIPTGIQVTGVAGIDLDGSSGTLLLGTVNATVIQIGHSGVPANITAGVRVPAGLADAFDASANGALNIGTTHATSIALGSFSLDTTVSVPGNLTTTTIDVPIGGQPIFLGGSNAGAVTLGNAANTTLMTFQLESTRDLLLQSSGYVAVLQNGANAASSHGMEIQCGQNGAGTTSNFLEFTTPNNTVCGAVTQASANTVTYTTSSDRRLKENIKPSKRGLDVVRRLNVCEFNFIGDPTRFQGFIAQEVMEVYPDVVKLGGEDARTNPFSIDYGKITPLLALAVQELEDKHDRSLHELREEIAALRAKIAA